MPWGLSRLRIVVNYTIHRGAALPKTRSGKIMRRTLRKIASNEADQVGETSTLADPSAVEALIGEYKPVRFLAHRAYQAQQGQLGPQFALEQATPLGFKKSFRQFG